MNQQSWADQPCKHCGQQITLDRGTYWVHVDTSLVTCESRTTVSYAEPR